MSARDWCRYHLSGSSNFQWINSKNVLQNDLRLTYLSIYRIEIVTSALLRPNRWTWYCHQMETFSALLAICAGNSPVTGEFPSQRPVARSFYVFFDLCLNKRLSKQSWRRWFETLSRSLWRHHNACWLCRYTKQSNDHLTNFSRNRWRKPYLWGCLFDTYSGTPLERPGMSH